MSNAAIAVTEAFVAAINQHDPAALAALMTADHRFVDSLGNVVEGRDAMKAGWVGYFRMVPDYSLDPQENFAVGSVVVMLGTACGTWTADGELKPENRWETPLAVRALVEEGKIAEWRVYADNEPIRKIMSGRR